MHTGIEAPPAPVDEPLLDDPNLGNQLESIPGVASAEVTLPVDGPPIARVFLDGTRPSDEVRERVQALLGSAVPQRPDPITDPEPSRRRRSGLGRGLGEVIEAHDAEGRPAHLVGSSDPAPIVVPRADLTRVAVVEAVDGVHVEVEDSLGNRTTAAVHGSIDAAIVEAVSDLLALDDTWDVALGESVTEHGEVVIATGRRSDGSRVAGAACIEFGRPWAVARALVDALRG